MSAVTDTPDEDRTLTVSTIASYARRDRDRGTIRVVLTVSGVERTDARTWVRFVGEHDAFRVPATTTPVGDDLRVEVAVPADRLPAGMWRLRLRQQGGPLRNLQTRLLVSDLQPIALLTGPSPKTRMSDHAS